MIFCIIGAADAPEPVPAENGAAAKVSGNLVLAVSKVTRE